jgi:hypothetical protein
MARIAYDCTRSNAAWVAKNLPVPDLIMWYGTGSPDIQWGQAELDLFPHSIKVQIDQGGTGSPIQSATVRDVEPRAWVAANAVNHRPWVAPRPTIYCDRADLDGVLAAGWKGDVWLAWPGFTRSDIPRIPGCNLVAIQDQFHAEYDRSLVYDDTWPFLALKESDMIFTEVGPGETKTIPFPAGSFSQVIFAHDFTNPTTKFALRVAVRSASKGYTIHTVEDAVNGPVSYVFMEHDVDAISVGNANGPAHVGITLA